MADPLAGYSLRPVQSPQQWSAYHAIRRDAIFATLLPGQVYDEHDPAEFEHRHRPHVLVRDGEVMGTVRIDPIGDIQAGLRLIAIRRDLQRQGTAAFCCGSRNKPRALSAGPRSSSTPTRRR